MSTVFVVPSGFTITDQEFLESCNNREHMYDAELHRAPVEATDESNRTFMDRLGRGRWPIDYYTARIAGYTHSQAMQVERVRIREAAGLPASEPLPPPPPPAPLPIQPSGRAVVLGEGEREPHFGRKLPLPAYGAQVCLQLGRAAPELLARSCQDQGGTWEWLDLLVSVLRTYDTRWGYNGKRGNANDPSRDVVAYHWGSGPDEGSTDVYIIDVIGGHCGASPQAIWDDVTDITIAAGTIGRWISRGRF